MPNKKFKKMLQQALAKIDARINVLEANVSSLILAALEALSQPAKKEKAEKTEKSKKSKESKEPKTETPTSEAAARPEEHNEAPAEAKPKRRRRTAEEIAAEKEANSLTADDLRHIDGIGPTYAKKMQALGIQNLNDLVNISPEKMEELDAAIKGFKSRFTSNNWLQQAKELLAKKD